MSESREHDMVFERRDDGRVWLVSPIVQEVWVSESLLKEAQTSNPSADGAYLDCDHVLTLRAANARLRYRMGEAVPGQPGVRSGQLIDRLTVNPEAGVVLS